MKLEDMQSHSYALWQAGLILQKQSQPIDVIDADKMGFTLRLRTNLQNVQAERLIVKPMNDLIVEYSAQADFKLKTLRVQKNVVRGRKPKSAGGSGEAES